MPPFQTTYSASATRLWKSRASCLQPFVSDKACLTTGHYSVLITTSEDACQSDLYTSLERLPQREMVYEIVESYESILKDVTGFIYESILEHVAAVYKVLLCRH